MDKNKVAGHFSVLLANIIFGIGVPVTAWLLAGWVTPMTYMAARCVGAALIFWAISLFLPKERIAGKDLLVIMGGGLLGFVISQTLTAWALYYTTPVYFSVIASLTPVATMLMAALFISEKITVSKAVGVAIGIVGAMLGIIITWQSGTGKNDILGITLAVLSLLSWAVYLIITRKVSQKYSAVSQMKWVFLVSTIAVLPFAWHEFPQTRLFGGEWQADSLLGWSGMLFIIVFATVAGYFAIPFAMRYLKATTVSIYTNLQPIVASFIAIWIGQDLFSWDKPVALILVLLSAYVVTKENRHER
ncbi:DMT family transporter [Prevotella sp. KH2C16]|uniref:DMT family transporter n=1 Tax=Prevotella sp. KH2C16 TaxID=1855325 RepID=UPI0008E11BBD|nr:DMT family transporter [Prevotella sp. KH2C16]SFG65541.1 Permease of the drug/metabolite transporter (DMT) superfamily [Prevotella sp. KH2C16]